MKRAMKVLADRKQRKGGLMEDIFYNDTLWTVFFIFNVLYALGRIMVRYNYSSVSDSNPISVALHSGIYLICVSLIYRLFVGVKLLRCSMMEILYFGLKLFVLSPQLSESFPYLLAARIICILAGILLSFTLLKTTYKETDKGYDIRVGAILSAAALGLILFLIIYHKYVIQMAFGAFIIAIVLSAGPDLNVSTGDADSLDGDTY